MPATVNKNRYQHVHEIARRLGIKTTRFWINMLHGLPPHQVGVIKASGKLLENGHLEQLCAEIAYLAESADFYLPLVTGVAIEHENRLVAGLTENAFQPPAVNRQARDKMIPLALANQKKVVDHLSQCGREAVAISPNSVLVQPLSSDLGFVGNVINIDTKPIIKAIYEKKIPVITHLGFCRDDNNLYYINARMLAKEVVKWMQAQKLIFVDDYAKKQVESIVLPTMSFENEFERLVQEGVFSADMRFIVEEAFELLKLLGPKHSIQITSLKYEQGRVQSTGLLEEIIGNGSGIKVVIPPVITAFPLEAVDQAKLRQMTDQSFSDQDKVLHKDYFESIRSKSATVYLDSGGTSGAISYPLYGCEYLCKLFTLKDYEGLGIGTSIIRTILLQKGCLCWRTDLRNTSVIAWYQRLLQNTGGFYRESSPYMIFGIGIEEKNRDALVVALSDIPPTMMLREA